MIVPDSSAWIEHLRRTGSPIHETLKRLLEEKAPIATTEVIVLEVLAGVRSPRQLRTLRAELGSFDVLPLEGLDDYEEAAALYRACRQRGETIRKLTDCLVAVPVIRAGGELLHRDSDFDAIARHSDLRIYATD